MPKYEGKQNFSFMRIPEVCEKHRISFLKASLKDPCNIKDYMTIVLTRSAYLKNSSIDYPNFSLRMRKKFQQKML